MPTESKLVLYGPPYVTLSLTQTLELYKMSTVEARRVCQARN